MRVLSLKLLVIVILVALSFKSAKGQDKNVCIADSLHNMASKLFEMTRDEDTALKLEKYAHQLLLNNEPVDSTKYYASIKSLAEYYNQSSDNTNDIYSQEAVRYYTEALDYCKRHWGVNHIDYRVMQSELGYIILKTNIEEGKSLIKSALANIDKSTYPKEFALSLLNYSWYLYYCDQISDARKYAKEACDILKLFYNSEEYTYALHQVAWYSYYLGDYEYAIPIQEECVKKRENLFGTRHSYYINSLNLLSALYEGVGDVNKSIPIYKQILVSYESIIGKENVDYSCSLNNLCETYTSIGDYNSALPLAKEALSIDLRLAQKGEYDRLDVSYNNVAYCYNHLGLNDSTLFYAKKSLDVTLQKFGDTSRELIIPYNNLAYYLIANHKFDEARVYANRSMNICLTDSVSNSALLINTLGLMAEVSVCEGDVSRAIQICENARNLCIEKIGCNNDTYIELIKKLCTYYFKIGNYMEVENYLEEYISYVCSSILREFLIIPPIKRFKFWEEHENTLCNEIVKYASMIKSEKMACIAYDAALISKSLLLSTEKTFRTIVSNSGDQETVRLLSKLDELCNEYNEVAASDELSTYNQLQFLEQEINLNYTELLKRSNIFSDIMNQYQITPSSISQHLKDNALSIEFAQYRIANDYMIVAIVCQPNNHFSIFPLCKESEFTDYNEDNQLHEKIYDIIWAPILSKYEECNTVYFSPSGIIHSMGIENIKLSTGNHIGEYYYLFRLSSTRELVLNNKSNTIAKAVVYGGIEYDDNSNIVFSDSQLNYSFSQSLWKTGKKKYLKGTLLEYNNLLKIFNKIGNIEVIGLSKSQGTEQSFKELSNSNINLLHVATHGFYKPIEDVEDPLVRFKYNSYNFALLRSGLIFSGANKHLNEKFTFNTSLNEGILTSQEISELDLSFTDLTVLSACESGLGDIMNSGVWGLQRGFKKAGVNSIIMSLWEIDDMATSLFMNEFYFEYLNGKSKWQALTTAQKYLMNYSNEYANPYYWAAFILLDGLN